ncbi:hypothetical protein J6590_096668 [Homalodisca vitripennis]|nr:hypothetical protein J6590_096668 [Homalodisca vitripennis]
MVLTKPVGALRSDKIKLSSVYRPLRPAKQPPLCRVGTHITAPRPTRQSAVCWPSYGERIAAQFSTCKSTHVRTDTRPSWPHRARTVTDMFSLNFDGHGAVYERHHMLFTVAFFFLKLFK